jgi:glycosyltransferase involved in cell wall biosynthesis
MKVSVVLPVLVREPQLADTVRRLVDAVGGRLDPEVLLVVDVPDPGREDEARSANDPLATETGARAVYRVGKRGFGSALRRGFAEAGGDLMIPMMGDASEDPSDVLRLVARAEEGFDVVAGARYMSGGRVVGQSPKQRASKLYSQLVRLAGGPPIHDVSNAFKAYRRSVVESVPTVSESFDISVELTVKAARAGFRVSEVPVVWINRRLGSSHFSVRRELGNYGRWLRYAAESRWAASPEPRATAPPMSGAEP